MENRHGSKSRDVGRVSLRGLGRSLARRPGSFHLYALAPVCSRKRSPALGRNCCPTTPFLWLTLPDEQEARPQQPFPATRRPLPRAPRVRAHMRVEG